MPKAAGSGLLSGSRREERHTVAPAETGTRPTKLRFEHKRHMYFDGRKWLPGVTSIAGKAEDKEGLLKWNAETTATCAIEEAAELSRIRRLEGDEAAFEWLSKAPDRAKEGKGVKGSDLHDVADRKMSGMDMPDWLFPDIEAMANRVLEFIDDYSVQVLFSEVRLVHRGLGYAGTTDLIGIVPCYGPKPMIIDWKTSESMYARPKFARGKNAMQLSAYRHAQLMFWDDRTEANMIETDPVGLIVMIRPEGYKVEDFDLSQAWPQFQRAIENFHWWRGAEALGRPARAPLASPVVETATEPTVGSDHIVELIRRAPSKAVAREIWKMYRDMWTPEFTAMVEQLPA